MPVRIFIKRHFKPGRFEEGIGLLGAFRKIAREQPGYLSSETLVNHYDGAWVTVVSTWMAVDDWVRWQNSAERDKNEARLESLLDRPTSYEIHEIYREVD